MIIKTIGTGTIYAKERSASTLIDNKILIDCGNGITKTLIEQNVDIGNIDILLITHFHGDHYFDIPFLLLTRLFNKCSNKFTIYGPIGLRERVDSLLKLAFTSYDLDMMCNNSSTEIVEFDKLDVTLLDKYKVKSYDVMHGHYKNAYGFTICDESKTIGISGDSKYCDSIDKIVSISDISLLDMSTINDNPAHMCYMDIKNIIEKYNKKIIATHVGIEVRKYAKENSIENLIIPNDGDKFEI